jgi:hypothetical protein
MDKKTAQENILAFNPVKQSAGRSPNYASIGSTISELDGLTDSRNRNA